MAGNMKGAGSAQQEILASLKECGKPTDLWSVNDISEQMGVQSKKIENAVYNLYIKGKLCRHRNKSDENQIQYALKIKDDDRVTYEAPAEKRSYVARRGQKASAKEIRVAFVEIQRAFTRLEDLIMPVIESAEEKDKAQARLKSVL